MSFDAVLQCDLDLRYFPFDRHCIKCFIEAGSVSKDEQRFGIYNINHLEDASEITQSCALGGNFASAAVSRMAVKINGIRLVPDLCQEEDDRVLVFNRLRKEGWTTESGHEDEPPEIANVELRLDVSRFAWYYVSHIFMPLVALLVMNVVIHYVPPEAVEFRVGVTSTLFLACVAFQYTTVGTIPTLAYNTLFDNTILIMNGMFVSSIVESIAGAYYLTTAQAWTADWIYIAASSGLALMWAAYICIIVRRTATNAPHDFTTIYPDTLLHIPTYQLAMLDDSTYQQLVDSEEADWEGEEDEQRASERESHRDLDGIVVDK